MQMIDKYLNNYAEPETAFLEDFPNNLSFKHCIVIPTCNEESKFIERLSESCLAESTLLILVINQSPNATSHACSANLKLAEQVKSSALIWKHKNLALHSNENLYVLLVDRFSSGFEIPEKEGVGRARKLGCDLAVALFRKNRIQSPWIYSTDADASLPANYFSAEESDGAAMVFNFEHTGESGAVLDATLLYERALKYYREALAWSGSPYAFYTLGSTLAVEIDAYCKVRGFPSRAGAEDFYLLNKLAKIGRVRFVEEICVNLEARLSDRVPFGTGPAVQKILALSKSSEAYCYYHPDIFRELRTLLHNTDALRDAIFSDLNLENVMGKHCTVALNESGFSRFTEHCIRQKVAVTQFERGFHTWFDAFQTLKFIHFLQKNVYPPLELGECEQRLHQYRQATQARPC